MLPKDTDSQRPTLKLNKWLQSWNSGLFTVDCGIFDRFAAISTPQSWQQVKDTFIKNIRISH